jgi:maleylpyruvate isomerase
MKLYSYWRSSSSWRVRIALAWKGLAYDLVPVHLLRDGGEQHLPEFVARNPAQQVPVLVEDDGPDGPFVLTQSMAIIEYLEERHPEPPLLPPDPRARARVRELAQLVNSGIQPLQNLAVQQKLREAGLDPIPMVRGFVATGLDALEQRARSGGGKFLVGDAPTMADLYLVPQLYASRRVGVDVDAFPTLRAIELRCERLPAFQRAHPDAQPDREPAPTQAPPSSTPAR